MDNKLKRGILTIFIANAINMFFSLGNNFLLPKYISIDNYANIKTFQLYISYAGLLHLGYIDGMYLKYGGKEISEINSNDLSRNINTMKFFQAIVVVVLLLISLIIKDCIFVIFAISILPLNMSSYFKFLFQATGKFKLYAKILNLTSILTFALNMFFIFIFKIENYLVYITSYFILYMVIWILLEINVKENELFLQKLNFSFSEVFLNIKEGFLLTLGNLSSIFLVSMDRWFVKVFLSTMEFAQYSFAVSIENFLNLAITPISTSLYNYFCRKPSIKSQKNIFDNVIIFSSLIISVAFPVKLILEIYLQKYLNSISVIFILFGSQMFYSVIKSVYVNLYKAEKKLKIYFTKLIIIIFIGFTFNNIFFRFYPSMEAFSLGTLISSIVWFFISSMDFKQLKISINNYFYMFLEVTFFIFIGIKYESVAGFFMYIIISIIMMCIFMRPSISNIVKLIKKNTFK